ncbi:mRNA 3' end processing factor [Cyanidiococcus yangmingshanensis]|uniref:mRNA 3' end processing factor n=1 Tax=Cyanidiococcus yangmingshanensis TaxID=2690220 RepID=A0A7J7IE11_9RHOD|nr:mRNA 3' end processing factor [Cyanidiococcus yangmingshanensis]
MSSCSVTPTVPADADQATLAAEAFRDMFQQLENNNAPMINALAWIALENQDAAPEIAALFLQRLARPVSMPRENRRGVEATPTSSTEEPTSSSTTQEDAILATLYLIDSIVKRVGPFLEAARRYRTALESLGFASVLGRTRKQWPSLQKRIDKLVNLWQEGRYFGANLYDQVLQHDVTTERTESALRFPTSNVQGLAFEEVASTGDTATVPSLQHQPMTQVLEPLKTSNPYPYQTDIQMMTERLIQFVQHGILPPAEDVTTFERLIQTQMSMLGPQDWSMRQYLEQLRMHMQMTIRSLAESRRIAPTLAPAPQVGIGSAAYPATGNRAMPPSGPGLMPLPPPASVGMPLAWGNYETPSAVPYPPNLLPTAFAGPSQAWAGQHTVSTHSHTSAVAAPVGVEDSQSVSSGSEDRRHHRRERCLAFRDIKRVPPGYAVAQLYNKYPLKADGTGIRFRTRSQLRSHLDWVFAENQRIRLRQRGGMSRNWYVPVNEWMRWIGGWPGTGFEASAQGPSSGEDLLKDPFVEAGLVFAQAASPDDHGTAGLGNQASHDAISERAMTKRVSSSADSSVTAQTEAIPAVTEDAVCPICHEELETFYDAEQDQWMWRNAVMDPETGLAFHRKCYGDGVNLMERERPEQAVQREHQKPAAEPAPKRFRSTRSASPNPKNEADAKVYSPSVNVPTPADKRETVSSRSTVPENPADESNASAFMSTTSVQASNEDRPQNARTCSQEATLCERPESQVPDTAHTTAAKDTTCQHQEVSKKASEKVTSTRTLHSHPDQDLNTLTVRVLRERLDTAGIEHRHLKRKAELVAALRMTIDRQSGPDPSIANRDI